MYWVFRAFDYLFSEAFFIVGYFTLTPFIVANILCRSFDITKLRLQLISIAMILSIAASYYFYFYNTPFGAKSYPMILDFLTEPLVVEGGVESLEMILVPILQIVLISLAMSASRWLPKRFKPNASAK